MMTASTATVRTRTIVTITIVVLANDATLLSGDPTSSAVPSGVGLSFPDEDPDGASMERLSKSCLTVHASSARPEQLNVTFQLYTRNNLRVPYILSPQITRLELIKGSPFNPGKPIKWITHGFHTNLDKSSWIVEVKDKILVHEDANVILTDWRRGASPAMAFYPKAAANAHIVAKMIVKIIRRLRQDIDFSQIHLIGHSLGAHIMGFVGSAFTEEYLYQQQQILMLRSENESPFWKQQIRDKSMTGVNQLIGRITACDPALPCFEPTSVAVANIKRPMVVYPLTTTTTTTQATPHYFEPQSISARDAADNALDSTPSMWTHLRPDSAVVVEVMHSNPGVMGYSEPLGDYDFYPNGLEHQPGCEVGQIRMRAFHNSQQPSDETSTRFRRQSLSLSNFLSSIRNPISNDSERSHSKISQTIGKFIKPIREFFQVYTCSHHRSVEYMVESMYYELVPQFRKLDRDFVCQMVGYRCKNYASFKKGFCFRCLNELDCRTFTMPANTRLTSETNFRLDLASQFQAATLPIRTTRTLDKFKVSFNKTLPIERMRINTQNKTEDQGNNLNEKKTLRNMSHELTRRVLPALNHYNQNLLAQQKNQYYFDTKQNKDFCLHHYHFHIKYRWFRIRENVSIDGFNLIATLANITQHSQLEFNRFTPRSYTMLLTEPVFLGQIESLITLGDRIKPSLIEYIEITYMSNLDARVRALGSARLCRSSEHVSHNPSEPYPTVATLFVRCSGMMV